MTQNECVEETKPFNKESRQSAFYHLFVCGSRIRFKPYNKQDIFQVGRPLKKKTRSHDYNNTASLHHLQHIHMQHWPLDMSTNQTIDSKSSDHHQTNTSEEVQIVWEAKTQRGSSVTQQTACSQLVMLNRMQTVVTHTTQHSRRLLQKLSISLEQDHISWKKNPTLNTVQVTVFYCLMEQVRNISRLIRCHLLCDNGRQSLPLLMRGGS